MHVVGWLLWMGKIDGWVGERSKVKGERIPGSGWEVGRLKGLEVGKVRRWDGGKPISLEVGKP